jgi:2'-hydroxyisoflavone reductase
MAMTRREFLGSAAASTLVACAGAGPAGAAGAVVASSTRAGAGREGPLRILILGGTAFLGPELVEAAVARGHVVTLFNRGKTRPGLFPELEKLRGDREGQLEALRGRRWDVAIDTSGYVPRLVRLSAELLAPAIDRYVFISSISAYAEDVKPPVGEEAPLAVLADPKSEEVRKDYGALKAACEEAAEAALPGRALSIRPGLIVGPGDPTDRFTYWPVRLARGGEVLAPGDGADPVQVIDVRDLAAFVIRCAEARRAGRLNATGPATPLAMRDFLAGVAEGVGVVPSLTWVDEKLLAESKVSAWTDLPVWIPRAEPMGQVSVARAVAAGLVFRPLADTARDTLAWWRAQPEDRRAKPRTGLTVEREAAVLATWHARTPSRSGP